MTSPCHREIRRDKRAVNNLGIGWIKSNVLPPSRINISNIRETNTGERIRMARLMKNLTVEAIARDAEIATDYLSQLERGKYEPSIATLSNIAKALNMPVSQLGCFESLPESTFPQKVHKLRLFMGMQIFTFANYLGVNERTVRYWELDIQSPSLRSSEMIDQMFPLSDIHPPLKR